MLTLQMTSSSYLLLWPPQAASFVRERLYDGDSRRLRRAFTRSASAVDAFADDYALVVRGLLDLHAVTGDVAHLQASARRAARLNSS
jgi:uncharacterized protein YyaL (SSP411 family)